MKNTILFNKVDREDYWVSGIGFKVENTKTYEDAYNEVKDKIEAKATIDYIIDNHCLLDDLFKGDETYKFDRTYWNYALFFVFKNSEGDELEFKYSSDFIYVPN